MTIELPLEVQQLVDNQLATGLYSSSVEVLREAMHTLVEQQATIEDLQASLEDVEAGHLLPLSSVVADVRRRRGWTS